MELKSTERNVPVMGEHNESKSARSRCVSWKNSRTNKLLDWIERNDAKAALSGFAPLTQCRQMYAELFSFEENVTVDKIRYRLRQMKLKFDATDLWLKSQKDSQRTEKGRHIVIWGFTSNQNFSIVQKMSLFFSHERDFKNNRF